MKNITNFCFILFVSIIISCNSENEGENIIENNNQNKEMYEALKLNLNNYLEAEAKTNQLEEYILDNKSCFSIKYPIKILMPHLNGSNEKIEMVIGEAGQLRLPLLFGGSDNIIYPITIFTKSGKELEIKNAIEFDKQYNDCKGIESCEECKRNCFRLPYPLRLVKTSGDIKTIESDKELNTFIENLKTDELFKLTYPLRIYVYKDSKGKTIQNTEELNSIFSNCFN